MDWKKALGLLSMAVGAMVLAYVIVGVIGDDGDAEHQRAGDAPDSIEARKAQALERARNFQPGAGGEAAEQPEEPIPLDEDPRIRVVTPHCRQLIGHMRRNVPSDVLLDMIRDGGMRFDDDDIQCMSVAGAKPAIVDMAIRQLDRNEH